MGHLESNFKEHSHKSQGDSLFIAKHSFQPRENDSRFVSNALYSPHREYKSLTAQVNHSQGGASDFSLSLFLLSVQIPARPLSFYHLLY